MKKLIIALALLSATFTAQAGFLTGFAVGVATSEGGITDTSKSTIAVWSDKHDVIVCKPVHIPGQCFVQGAGKRIFDKNTENWQFVYPIEKEYALNLGYQTIHKRGIVIQNGVTWTVMEVSK